MPPPPGAKTLLRCCFGLLLFVSAFASFADSLQLASRLERPPISSGSSTDDLSTSADGRFVVFSSGDLLVGDDTNGNADVFVIDRGTDEIILVSHASGNPGRTGNGNSLRPKISADGNTVVYASLATDLTATTDNNGALDIFLWRRDTRQTLLVSQGLSGESGNGSSDVPYVDATGSHVAFESFATDLAAVTDGNGESDIFLWEQATGQIVLASHAAGTSTVAANRGSSLLGFDEAGDGVLSLSSANNLVPAFVDRNFGSADFFHWRRSTGSSRLVSRSTLGDATNSTGNGDRGQLSADGSSVVFVHNGQDLIPGFLGTLANNLYHWDTTTGDMLLISHDGENLTIGGNGSSFSFSLSQNGDTVAFDSTASNLIETDGNGFTDVYLWQRAGSTVELVSRNFLFPFAANAASYAPKLSRNGEVLSFLSNATDLVDGFIPAAPQQTYARRPAQGIQLVSRSSTGPTQAANSLTETALPTADGSAILFLARAGDILDNVDSGLFAFDLASEDMVLLNLLCRPLFPLMDSPVGDALESSISDDGRFVVFHGSARPLIDDIEFSGSTGQVHLWDGATGEVTLVSRSIAGPTIAANSTSNVAKKRERASRGIQQPLHRPHPGIC